MGKAMLLRIFDRRRSGFLQFVISSEGPRAVSETPGTGGVCEWQVTSILRFGTLKNVRQRVRKCAPFLHLCKDRHKYGPSARPHFCDASPIKRKGRPSVIGHRQNHKRRSSIMQGVRWGSRCLALFLCMDFVSAYVSSASPHVGVPTSVGLFRTSRLKPVHQPGSNDQPVKRKRPLCLTDTGNARFVSDNVLRYPRKFNL